NDREQIEDLIVVAVNRAMEQADNVSQAEMQAIAKDMLPGGLGGLGNLFGK
ncbi:MAG: YbaB/EbfC family nucleoid-associated protein, partial [Bacteroidia bacterium]|nr:YbaB/EbfC family nucleoid-associated protein [Bacteroidia bacterium]